MEQSSVRVINGYHPLTVKLISALEHGNPGDIYTDEQLTELIGVRTGVGGKGYGYLMSAMRYCERSGVTWQRVPGTGTIVCQTPMEIVKRTTGDIGRVRRTAKRAAGRLGNTDTAGMADFDRKRAYALAAQLGAIAMLSKGTSTKAIEARVADTMLQIGETLKIFEK